MALAAPVTAVAAKKHLRQRIIDCDVHHNFASHTDLYPYLPRQFREQMDDFGPMAPHVGYTNMPGKGTRHDLWHSLDNDENPNQQPKVAVEHHIETYDIDFAVLTGGPYNYAAHPTLDFAAAICRAFNDFTVEYWLATDSRMRGSIHIAPNDPPTGGSGDPPTWF